MSIFDDFDEFGPSNPNSDGSPIADPAADPSTSTLVMAHSCNRIGMQATPPSSFSRWLRRR